MAGKPIKIADEEFPSRAAAERKIRSILDGTELYGFLEGDTAEFISALVWEHHPAPELKCIDEIVRVQVEPRDGGRGFLLYYANGSRNTVSWRKCLRHPTNRDYVMASMRISVRDQVEKFREDSFSDRFSIRCPLTGGEVTFNSCHVDHVIPFVDLADRFLSCHGLTAMNAPWIYVDGLGPRWIRTRLEDESLDRAWKEFHAKHAVLRITTVEGNLSRGSRK